MLARLCRHLLGETHSPRHKVAIKSLITVAVVSSWIGPRWAALHVSVLGNLLWIWVEA